MKLLSTLHFRARPSVLQLLHARRLHSSTNECSGVDDEYYMRLALAQAQLALEIDEVPIGAVLRIATTAVSPHGHSSRLSGGSALIVPQEGKSVPPESRGALVHSAAMNAPESSGSTSALHHFGSHNCSNSSTLDHAEMRVFSQAVAATGRTRLDGSTLYITSEPCIMCFGASLLHHISRIVYGCPSPKFGAFSSGAVDIESLKYNHRIILQGGCLSDEAATLLKDFFAKRRRAPRILK